MEIKFRTGADQVRKAPNIMLGSSGIEGAKHAFLEIISNSVDEANSGFGDVIHVGKRANGAVWVRDFGRGVPLGYSDKLENADGSLGGYYWDKIFNTLYSSGKYENHSLEEELLRIHQNNAWDTFNSKDYPYLYSVGVHGVGATATQYSSEWFEVKSYDGKTCSRMLFKKGLPALDELEVFESNEPRGTYIEFKPDIEVFTDVDIPETFIKSLCESFAMVGGISFEYESPTGELQEFKPTPFEITSGAGEEFVKNETFHSELSGNLVNLCEVETYIIPHLGKGVSFYNNLVAVSGGVHGSAWDAAVSKFVREHFKNKGIKVSSDDYSSAFSGIVITQSNRVDYRGQTKDSLDNPHIYNAVLKNLNESFTHLARTRPEWATRILSEIERRALDRINRSTSLKELKEVRKVMKNTELPSKFTTCLNYEVGNYSEVELFIAEGDSAKDSILQARNSTTQCILPQRGKSLNIYKATTATALRNEEIKSLMQVLGCGIETGDSSTFNINNLRCDKIIFASDADVDGFHIRNLNFLIFLKFFPQLLYAGKVFIAETPRYSITTPGGETTYYRDDLSFQEAKSKISGTVRRYKGLGEVDAPILSQTTVHPATRNLVPLVISEDDTSLALALEVMYGKDIELRKQLVLDMCNKSGYEEYLTTLKNFVAREKKAIESLQDEMETLVV